MFKLLAGRSVPGWTGQIAAESFDTLEDAERRMRDWARFGIDAYCNDPDTIWITDADDRPLKYWDWRTRRAETPEAGDGQA